METTSVLLYCHMQPQCEPSLAGGTGRGCSAYTEVHCGLAVATMRVDREGRQGGCAAEASCTADLLVQRTAEKAWSFETWPIGTMKRKGSENGGVSGSLGSVGSQENSLSAGEQGPVAAVAKPNWTIIWLNPAIFVSELLQQSAVLMQAPPKYQDTRMQGTQHIGSDSLAVILQSFNTQLVHLLASEHWCA